MPSDPARKSSDGPAPAQAGQAVTERQVTAAAEAAGADRRRFETGTARADAARPARSPAGTGATGPARSSAGVLADRLAAALVHHEPGWRLPRHTALARRYNVSTAQIDAALGELAARRLIRRLPDGQLYRVSPAECLIPLAGTPRLAAHIDPMGGQIACRSRQVSWRRVPEDIGWALGVAPGDPACVIRLLWTSDGEPAALATTYLARHLAGNPAGQGDEPLTVPPAVLAALPLLAAPGMDDWPPGFLLPGADGGTAASGAPGADPEPAGAGMSGAGKGAARAGMSGAGAGLADSGASREGEGAARAGMSGAGAGPADSGASREGEGAARAGMSGAGAGPADSGASREGEGAARAGMSGAGAGPAESSDEPVAARTEVSGVTDWARHAADPGAAAEARHAGTGDPAVVRTEPAAADAGEPGTAASGEPGTAACLPRALFVELQPPPPAVARSLRLSAGQPAAMITVRFDEPAGGRAAALMVAVLRPDLFRIVVESPASGSPGRTAGSFSGAWTYALQDWEP